MDQKIDTEQESAAQSVIERLSERSRDIFRQLVETYLETGEPVGSRTLSRLGPLSAASIRNVMADLTDIGLLHAPHASAGRLPTDMGLRLFVDGLLQVGDLTSDERQGLEAQIAGRANSVADMLTQASQALSGLTNSAGLVVVEAEPAAPLKHIEFVAAGPGQALVIMVDDQGQVENRLIATPLGLPPSALSEASNYLNARLRGRTIAQASADVLLDLESKKAELDRLTAKLVADGVADWSGERDGDSTLIVRGRSNLLEEGALADVERVRRLFDDLERKEKVVDLLGAAREGEGVRIFIGSENQLFSLSGSSVIVAPYRNAQQKIVGVLGVIGPTRLNYARVIPLVDYTAGVVSRLLK